MHISFLPFHLFFLYVYFHNIPTLRFPLPGSEKRSTVRWSLAVILHVMHAWFVLLGSCYVSVAKRLSFFPHGLG